MRSVPAVDKAPIIQFDHARPAGVTSAELAADLYGEAGQPREEQPGSPDATVSVIGGRLASAAGAGEVEKVR